MFKFDTGNQNVNESQGLGISFVDSPWSALYIRVFAYIAVISWYGTSSSYSVSSTETGLSEIFQVESTQTTSVQINISPGTEYVFNVYGDDVVIETSSARTSPVASGSSITDIVVFLENDFSTLDESSIAGVIEFLGEAISTTDQVTAKIHSNSTVSEGLLTFVNQGDSVSISDVKTPFTAGVLTSFTSGVTPTDTADILLSDDTTTEEFTFDETTNEITGNTVGTYSVGQYFILDGLKVRVASLE